MNTKISYLYRDANNYKIWNEWIVEGILTKEQQKQILDSLHEGEYFIPRKVGLPEGRFDKWDSADHIWFEMSEDAFEFTEAEPSISISVTELIKGFIDNKGKWEEDIIDTIEAAKESIERHQWVITDPDCLQVRRIADYGNQSVFELAQIDNYDLYDNRIYKIAHGDVDLSEYTDKEIAVFLKMYGYSNMNELVDIVGSELEAKGQLAEMIFETYNTDYHVDQYDSWNEAVSRIENYIVQDLSEYKKENMKLQMNDINYLSSFIHKEDEASPEEERFVLGMISTDGETFYISEKYGDIIRGSDLVVDSAITIDGKSDYYILGGYAENGLFFIYDGEGNIGEDERKSILAENPIYISEKMEEKLKDVQCINSTEKEPLSEKLKTVLEKPGNSDIKNAKNKDADLSL